MAESTLAFHLERAAQHGLDQTHLTSGMREGLISLRHAAMLTTVLLAGNQEPPYPERLRLHGDSATPEELLHPDELALLPSATQLVSLIACAITGRNFNDR